MYFPYAGYDKSSLSQGTWTYGVVFFAFFLVSVSFMACSDDPASTAPELDSDPEPEDVEVTVEGVVTGADEEPLVGAEVSVFRGDQEGAVGEATTADDGSYDIAFSVQEDNTPEQLRLKAEAEGFTVYEESFDFGVELSRDIVLEVAPVEVTVSGTLTDNETEDTIQGATLSGVRPDTGAGLFNIETGADGAYEALFEIEAGDEPTEITIEATADGFDSSEVTVAFSEELTVDFALAVSTVEVTVSGTVSEAGSGSSIASSTVTGVRAADGTTLFDATTEADGSYAATFEVADEPAEMTITATADEFESSEETVAFAEGLVVDFALEARFEQIGEPAVATDGMTVTLESLTFVDNDTFYEYSIQYTLKNETDSLIDEASFKMYFLNQSGGTPQFGFFGRLAPGESKTRSYTWQEDEGKFDVLEYHDDNFFSDEPLEESLKWKVPTE